MSEIDLHSAYAKASQSLAVLAHLTQGLDLPPQAREAIERSVNQMSDGEVNASLVSRRSASAMEHLRRALELIQRSGQEHLEEVSRVLARTLAILYPLSKSDGTSSVFPNANGFAKETAGSERRQARRLDIQAEIGIESDSNFFMGLTEDISTGGIFIATYDVRAIGSPINVNFTLPDGYLVSAEGVVRWVREYHGGDSDTENMPGMGVQFTGLSELDQRAIAAFVRQRQPIFYDD